MCEAVDRVIDDQDPIKRAFVAVRPPGHHCGEDTPSGFCFVNNVAVAAAHAYLKHKINRIVIFDIDLHHGSFPFCSLLLYLFIAARHQEMARNRSSGPSTRKPIAKRSKLRRVHQNNLGTVLEYTMDLFMMFCPFPVRYIFYSSIAPLHGLADKNKLRTVIQHWFKRLLFLFIKLMVNTWRTFTYRHTNQKTIFGTSYIRNNTPN